MSHILVETWLVVVMALSFCALALVVKTQHTMFWHTLPKTFRVGCILLSLGLGVQTYRSVVYLLTGAYPVDAYFPTWVVKDLGFCLIVYSTYVTSKEKSTS